MATARSFKREARRRKKLEERRARKINEELALDRLEQALGGTPARDLRCKHMHFTNKGQTVFCELPFGHEGRHTSELVLYYWD
jgi:hypothetical protein